MALWMVRSFPGQIDKTSEFLEHNIVAVHWGISNLTGCTTKEAVAKVVAKANLQTRDASLKTGLLHRFVNLMKVGDYCIIPYNNVFYSGIIKSDYYYDSNSNKFEHQRKIEFLFDGEPFDRSELPEHIQTSLKSQLGLADLTQHLPLFINYLNRKQGLNSLDDSEESNFMGKEVNSLIVAAMKIIKDEINSFDPDRRLRAAIAIMEMNHKQSVSKLIE